MGKHTFISRKLIIVGTTVLASMYGIMNQTAKRRGEPANLDNDNPYLIIEKKPSDNLEKRIPGNLGIYEMIVKPVMDKILSFLGLLLLSPIYILIGIAIYIDDPGPVFFSQTRIGRNKHFFVLHKFRSMKISTPHDTPTHMLKDPEQYITKVGAFLRRTSLDELPQIWDIFRGKMSIIGPRPALWNQDDLIQERDRYGANSILPGLTGLAQIQGRDELEIPDKARLDGKYTSILKRGGIEAGIQDIKCFISTAGAVFKHKGVVEGGTGCMNRVSSNSVGFEDYGCYKSFHINKDVCRRVLITGRGSYIGESFKNYVQNKYPNIETDTIDVRDDSWRLYDFSIYDVVFHVAGIAHADIGKVNEEEKRQYYDVNTNLAIEVCQKAKSSKVSQFIFMSSMIIYGESAPYGKKKIIDEYTIPAPANFYGDSKWRADKGVRELNSKDFHVVVLRAPMIYGQGSKGNYQMLEKISKKFPVFPNVSNERSMLYIDNLCELVSLLVMSGESGVYFPQNREYTKTSEMVKNIADTAGKKICNMKILAIVVKLSSYIPGKIGQLVNKAFGNAVYKQSLSEYEGLDYQLVNMKESINLIEKGDIKAEKKGGSIGRSRHPSILILVNHDVVIYNFRLELVEKLLSDGYDVHISSPYGEHINDLIALGAEYHELSINRHGMNPVIEISVLKEYKRLMGSIRPIVVLTYTIKPNIYGGIAAKEKHIPFIANITGLGTSIENEGVKKYLVLQMYKIGLYKAQKVFFQNEENQKFMIQHKIVSSPYDLLPGSGVNLLRHCYETYPKDTGELIFTTIGRVMKDKGINELLVAAKFIKRNYSNVRFRVIGFFDDDYKHIIKNAVEDGIIEYIEQQRDIHPFIAESHAIIHPSYHEGMSNVLLEAAATGRPVLASDIPGCKETYEEGVSGIGFRVRDNKDLIRAIKQFIELPYEKKIEMGRSGRRKMEKEFNRQVVVEKYIREIAKIYTFG